MERRSLLMTVEEVAGYLRVHEMTIYRLIQRGELPAVRIGRAWRFRKDLIDGWMTERQVNTHNGQPPSRPAGGRRRSPRER